MFTALGTKQTQCKNTWVSFVPSHTFNGGVSVPSAGVCPVWCLARGSGSQREGPPKLLIPVGVAKETLRLQVSLPVRLRGQLMCSRPDSAVPAADPLLRRPSPRPCHQPCWWASPRRPRASQHRAWGSGSAACTVRVPSFVSLTAHVPHFPAYGRINWEMSEAICRWPVVQKCRELYFYVLMNNLATILCYVKVLLYCCWGRCSYKVFS